MPLLEILIGAAVLIGGAILNEKTDGAVIKKVSKEMDRSLSRAEKNAQDNIGQDYRTHDLSEEQYEAKQKRLDEIRERHEAWKDEAEGKPTTFKETREVWREEWKEEEDEDNS